MFSLTCRWVKTTENARHKYTGTAVFFFFFFSPSSFPASGQAVVTGAVPSPPPVLAFNFYRAKSSAIPLLVGFSSSANSRSRAFRKSICAQEKVPTNLYAYALGGAWTHQKPIPGSRITWYATGATGSVHSWRNGQAVLNNYCTRTCACTRSCSYETLKLGTSGCIIKERFNCL